MLTRAITGYFEAFAGCKISLMIKGKWAIKNSFYKEKGKEKNECIHQFILCTFFLVIFKVWFFILLLSSFVYHNMSLHKSNKNTVDACNRVQLAICLLQHLVKQSGSSRDKLKPANSLKNMVLKNKNKTAKKRGRKEFLGQESNPYMSSHPQVYYAISANVKW